MTPLEIARLVNSAAFRPHKEAAVQMLAAAYAPGEPVSDNWYRDSRAEAVALLLYTSALAKPGATASAPVKDTRMDAIESRWPGLINILAK